MIVDLKADMRNFESQEQAIDDVTPQYSDNNSAFLGWEADKQEEREGAPSVIHTTRVGGATFIRNP